MQFQEKKGAKEFCSDHDAVCPDFVAVHIFSILNRVACLSRDNSIKCEIASGQGRSVVPLSAMLLFLKCGWPALHNHRILHPANPDISPIAQRIFLW
ncbi:MAG: hypothetical protein D3916_07635 [Candidatus Electrothrix sp. MAN1_4]|nr:hypothetical protein [Candidatus Electrothrix sp. MAN1_4]